MLIDTTPLATAGAYTVLAERHEVLFRDGSSIGLHQVLQRGAPCVYLRALVQDKLHAMVFDVRDVARALAAELPITPTRDLRGLVAITLRHSYPTANALAAEVMGVVLACALLTDKQLPAQSTHAAAQFKRRAADTSRAIA